MRKETVATLNRVLMGAAVLLILKVTLSVVVGYRDYLPPDFNSDFLLGREAYFYGAYRWAFYAHLISGPMSLVASTIAPETGSNAVISAGATTRATSLPSRSHSISSTPPAV